MNQTELKDNRTIFIKILLAIVLVASSATLIVNLFTGLQGANKEGIIGRVAEAQGALSKITSEPNDLVMFYGSSMTHAGFSPRLFDKKLQNQNKNIKSFNFGFGGLNPFYQDYLSRRIAEEFQSKNRRLKLAMIEFNPFQTTSRRWQNAQSTIDSYLTMLASDQELWEITKEDLTRGIRLFNIKYLRNDISAEMITSYYGRAIFPPQRTQQFKDDDETVANRQRLGKLLGEAFKKEYPDFKDAEWSYDWQGGGTIAEERSKETLQLFDEYYRVKQSDASMKNDRQGRINSADIEELNFEPELVESFIRIIKNFQLVSDKVEVMMLPRNTRYINYTAEGKLRLAKAIKQIEEATGITIRNHQEIDEVNPDMFSDTTHLAKYSGDVAYTEFLVRQYSDDL
jgi:hypothetical protein